jgi:hypothetical protein
MDVNYIVLLITAIVVALAYGLIGYFSALSKTGEVFQWNKLIATIIYSLFLGYMAVITGLLTLTNLSFNIFDPMWYEYVGALYLFQTIVDAIFARFGWQKGLAQVFVKKG